MTAALCLRKAEVRDLIAQDTDLAALLKRVACKSRSWDQEAGPFVSLDPSYDIGVVTQTLSFMYHMLGL